MYICQHCSLSSSRPPLPWQVHMSTLCICVSIPALQIGSSVPLLGFYIYALTSVFAFPFLSYFPSVTLPVKILCSQTILRLSFSQFPISFTSTPFGFSALCPHLTSKLSLREELGQLFIHISTIYIYIVPSTWLQYNPWLPITLLMAHIQNANFHTQRKNNSWNNTWCHRGHEAHTWFSRAA